MVARCRAVKTVGKTCHRKCYRYIVEAPSRVLQTNTTVMLTLAPLALDIISAPDSQAYVEHVF